MSNKTQQITQIISRVFSGKNIYVDDSKTGFNISKVVYINVFKNSFPQMKEGIVSLVLTLSKQKHKLAVHATLGKCNHKFTMKPSGALYLVYLWMGGDKFSQDSSCYGVIPPNASPDDIATILTIGLSKLQVEGSYDKEHIQVVLDSWVNRENFVSDLIPVIMNRVFPPAEVEPIQVATKSLCLDAETGLLRAEDSDEEKEPMPDEYYYGNIPKGITAEDAVKQLAKGLIKFKKEFDPKMTEYKAFAVLESWLVHDEDSRKPKFNFLVQDTELIVEASGLFPPSYYYGKIPKTAKRPEVEKILGQGLVKYFKETFISKTVSEAYKVLDKWFLNYHINGDRFNNVFPVSDGCGFDGILKASGLFTKKDVAFYHTKPSEREFLYEESGSDSEPSESGSDSDSDSEDRPEVDSTLKKDQTYYGVFPASLTREKAVNKLSKGLRKYQERYPSLTYKGAEKALTRWFSNDIRVSAKSGKKSQFSYIFSEETYGDICPDIIENSNLFPKAFESDSDDSSESGSDSEPSEAEPSEAEDGEAEDGEEDWVWECCGHEDLSLESTCPDCKSWMCGCDCEDGKTHSQKAKRCKECSYWVCGCSKRQSAEIEGCEVCGV